MTNLITSYAPTTTRSDNGIQWTGFRFSMATGGLYVSQLGLWKITGNTGTWTADLLNLGASGAVVATASFNMATMTAGQFNYLSVTPALLVTGVYYALAANVPASQTWNDYSPITLAAAGNATTPISAYQVTPGNSTINQFASGAMYTGLDMVFGPPGPTPAQGASMFLGL